MFEGLNKSKKALHQRRLTTFVAAIALHVVGVLVIGVLGRAAMKKVTGEDPIELVFRAPPPPPPAGGGKKKEKKAKKVEAKPVKTPEFVQPQEIPEEKPVESEEDVAEEEEVEGGVPGGVPGGIPGGVIGGTGTGPVDIAATGISPIAIYAPRPPYPPIARNANLTGSVGLEIIVDVDGTVKEAKITKSQPPFDEPALATIRKWRYQPVIMNGRPIMFKMKFTLRFTLN